MNVQTHWTRNVFTALFIILFAGIGAPLSAQVGDVMGQQVVTLVDQNMSAGHHSVKFNGAGHSSGIYFYRIQSGNVQITKQMTLLK